MAIPFYEPRDDDDVEGVIDQVDGHAAIPVPSANTTPTAFTASTTTTATNTATSTPVANIDSLADLAEIAEEIIAWKILALALCKALKEYYLQASTAEDNMQGPAMQMLPNGKFKPMWK